MAASSYAFRCSDSATGCELQKWDCFHKAHEQVRLDAVLPCGTVSHAARYPMRHEVGLLTRCARAGSRARCKATHTSVCAAPAWACRILLDLLHAACCVLFYTPHASRCRARGCVACVRAHAPIAHCVLSRLLCAACQSLILIGMIIVVILLRAQAIVALKVSSAGPRGADVLVSASVDKSVRIWSMPTSVRSVRGAAQRLLLSSESAAVLCAPARVRVASPTLQRCTLASVAREYSCGG